MHAEPLDTDESAVAAKNQREAGGIVNMLPVKKIPCNSSDSKKRRIHPTPVDL